MTPTVSFILFCFQAQESIPTSHCRNMGLQLGESATVLLGPSGVEVAGWGLYAERAVQVRYCTTTTSTSTSTSITSTSISTSTSTSTTITTTTTTTTTTNPSTSTRQGYPNLVTTTSTSWCFCCGCSLSSSVRISTRALQCYWVQAEWKLLDGGSTRNGQFRCDISSSSSMRRSRRRRRRGRRRLG